MADKPADIVGKVIKDFDEDKRPHDKFVKDVETWYRGFYGVIEQRSTAADWTNKHAPRYAHQVIETLCANVVDPKPRWDVRAQPSMADAAHLAVLREGAKANELLLGEQIECDHFAEKQMVFSKQAMIAGLSVFKTYWRYEEREVRRQAVVHKADGYGNPVPVLSSIASNGAYDNPTAEVVDVRDWIPHQGAVSLDRAMRVTHRVWYTFDELKQLEARGIYGKEAGGESVDKLKESRDFGAEASSREKDLFESDRTKDKIEVLEMWRKERDGSLSVKSIGNRNVLLRDRPSPFWHGQFPFVVCTPIPDATQRIPGISPMALIVDLQEAAWTLLNQRLDNTDLLNNAVWAVNSDLVDDIDQVVGRRPGSLVEVNGPVEEAVKQMQVDPMPAQISIQSEEMLKSDIQNIPGASPTLLGQSDPSAQTATEISLTTSLAQRRIALMKQQFKWAYKRVGEQFMAMNQQFVNAPRMVERIGADGARAFAEIQPLLLQGDYYIALEAMDQSLIRQERLAEAQARLQVAANTAQFFVGLGLPAPNLRKYMDDCLEAAGIDDKDAYYTAAPPPQAPPGGAAV